MITVRIAHAEYRPGMERVGTFRADRVLVVLADDAGGRAADLAAVDGRLFDSCEWASHEVSALVPEGAVFVQFGVTLNGRGRLGLRDASLGRRH